VVLVDTFDCVAWAGGVRRTAGSFQAGDVVSVQGALRRRFWRAGAATASRCEVEVAAVKRLVKAQASR
jgi:single-strand DNA-binding protein